MQSHETKASVEAGRKRMKFRQALNDLSTKAILCQFILRLIKLNSKIKIKKAIISIDPKIKEFHDDGRPEWTNIVLNTLAKIGENKYTPFPSKLYYYRKKGRAGNRKAQNANNKKISEHEYFVDMAWWYPKVPKEIRSWFDYEIPKQSGLKLVCECEWSTRNDKNHLDEMCIDFSKLIDIKAQIKLFIGQTKNKEMTQKWLCKCSQMIECCKYRIKKEDYAIILYQYDGKWTGKSTLMVYLYNSKFKNFKIFYRSQTNN